MNKEYKIPENIKSQDLVRGIVNASYWHWHTIDKIQHTEAIKHLNNLEQMEKILKQNNARFIKKCERWLELLKTDGCNSKLMVANDIQALLEEIKK